MPTIIDITPVSSHTEHTEPPREPESRFAHAVGLLRARLIVMGFVLAALAALAALISIGIFVFIAVATIALVLVATVMVRAWWQRLTAGRAVGPHRGA